MSRILNVPQGNYIINVPSGKLSITSPIEMSGASSNLSYTDGSVMTLSTTSTSGTSQLTIDSFAIATYRSAKYLIQLASASSYHSIEIIIIHNGTTSQIVTFGSVFAGSSLGTFATSIVSGQANLLYTPAVSGVSVKLFKHLITI